MRIAYFDCASGISGDMTLGALIDAGAPLDRVREAVRAIGLDQVRIDVQNVKKCGFRALQVRIEHPPERAHRHLHHIEAMFDRGALDPRVRRLASDIFLAIGQAEAKVHGTDLKKVHFHEVGAIDSITDILGIAVALSELKIDRVESSPVPTGCGSIEIDHGRVSVPAPATAELLCGIPLAPSSIEAELTTPTGAAVLRVLARRFGGMPAMVPTCLGYGAGTRDLPGQPNLLRVVIGNVIEDQAAADRVDVYETDTVWTLQCNLDDAAPSDIAVYIDRLFAAGALEVYQTPCLMKKGRCGIELTVLASSDTVAGLEEILFSAGLTLGVRRWSTARHKLARFAHAVETTFGTVAGKCARLPSGQLRFAPEQDSLKQVATACGMSLQQVREAALLAFRDRSGPQ